MARRNPDKVTAATPPKEADTPAVPTPGPEPTPAERPSGIGWWWVPVVVWLGALLVLFGIDFVGFLIKLFTSPAN
jgi:hypothetical protein